ncbi:hypothetical protein PM082_009133 [Marasmius tenuissimus]|nr:hypothetical protein PM082_009133 [Marasmius tenuissimus]
MWALMNACWDATPSSQPTASHVFEKVKGIASNVSASPALDWSESLLVQVWENIKYRTVSPVSPDGPRIRANQSFSDLAEATPSSGMHQRATLDPAVQSFPLLPVRTSTTSSEDNLTRVDGNSSSSSDSDAKGVASDTDHLKLT